MPKVNTFPDLFDDALQISITKLKKWNLLTPNQYKSDSLTWYRNGNERGSINIRVNMRYQNPYIELDYSYKDQSRNYKINFVSIPSNLGKGKIWYFLCPNTNKRCRILYSIGGYFLHREAFKGCMYESQTQNKTYRQLEKNYGPYFKAESLYDELRKKHFKKFYAGRPTKKYLKIMQQLNRAESYSMSDIEMLFIGK